MHLVSHLRLTLKVSESHCYSIFHNCSGEDLVTVGLYFTLNKHNITKMQPSFRSIQ